MLRIKNKTKRFQNTEKPAVDQISLTIEAHELVSLVGESGSGKTTLLRMVAGLEKPSAGTIHCGTRCFSSQTDWIPPEQRRVGLVFQGGALFPHMTVTQNIGYALGRVNKKLAEETTTDLLERVHLPSMGNRYPHELSGGEAQRVALARALAAKPEIILLDEPYSNLDVSITARLREEIRSILIAEKMTGLLVTHDPADARHFGQRIAILKQGKLEQIDSVEQVTANPANDYCRLLIGAS